MGYKAGEKALHVADLINNAASYFDLWFPLLSKAHVPDPCALWKADDGVLQRSLSPVKKPSVALTCWFSLDYGRAVVWRVTQRGTALFKLGLVRGHLAPGRLS